MNDQLTRIAALRCGVLSVRPGVPATPSILTAVLAEFARLGVRVANPAALNDSILDSWGTLHATLVHLRGGDKNYAPLFSGFPDQLPDVDDAWLRFGLAALRLTAFTPSTPNDTGYFFDTVTDDDLRTALDFSDWGWWPASSIPITPAFGDLLAAAQDILPADSSTEWVTLRVTDDALAAVHQFGPDCAYSASSLNAAVLDDLETLIIEPLLDDVQLELVRFREIRSLFYAHLFDRALNDDLAARELLLSSAPSPDDILRLLAVITGADQSLAGPAAFPVLKRAARRLVLQMLDSSPHLDDIWRRAGLWRAFAKSLHVGEYQKKYPRAYQAFYTLRSTRRSTSSPLHLFEAALSDNDLPAALSALAAPGAQGVVLRQIRRLASFVTSSREEDLLLDTFTNALTTTSVTRLLDLRAVLRDNGSSYPRMAITKAGSLLQINAAPGHLAINDVLLSRLLTAIDTAVAAACVAKGSWSNERVYIDPALQKILVPSQLRSASDARISVERGSRLAVAPSACLRLFVHWCQPAEHRSDLDLSCISLDDDFNYHSHVSWTRLTSATIVHSGDITNAPAPHGASEFIDIDRDRYLADPGGRYLVPCILRFAGPAFASLPEAFAGWMLRDDTSSLSKAFDPSTVVSAFDLTGSAPTSIPFVFDTKENEIIYLDGYSGQNATHGSSVENAGGYISSLAATCASRHLIRASLYDLASAHVTSRGATTTTRENATITFGLDDADTYNALRPEKILANLA